MKRVIIYALISVVSFGAAGGGTIFYLNEQQHKNVKHEQPVEEEVVETNQEKFMNKILENHLNIKNLDLNIKDLEPQKDLFVNFKGAFDYKGLDLARGDFSQFSIQGDLHAKYGEIDESVNLTFIPGSYVEDTNQNGLTNGKVYFTFHDQDFSFNANTVLDVLKTVEAFGVPTENIANSQEVEETEEEAFDITTVLDDMVETETETGFEYTINIQDIGGITLISNKTNDLTGLKTQGDLNINGLKLNLNAEVETGDSSFVNNNKVDGTNLDSIAGIFESVQEIYQDKNINTNFNIKFREVLPQTNDGSEVKPLKANDGTLETKLAFDLNGQLSLDLKDAFDITNEEKPDFQNGKYAITLFPTGSINGNKQVNDIKALYNDGFIYLQVNDLLKGKLSNQSIEDIFSIVSTKVEVPQLDGGLNKINEFLKGSAIERLINGDYLAIKEILKDVKITNTKYEFVFKAEAFNLAAGDITLTIDLDENSHVKTLTLVGLNYENYFLDFTLNLEKYVDLAGFFENLDSFKDYYGAIDIYNSVANIVNTKKLNADYKIRLFDTVNATDSTEKVLTGKLKGDVNGVDFNNLSSVENGKYFLNLNTIINNQNQALDVTYLQSELFVNYNDLITNSVSNAAISKTIEMVNNLTNNQTNENQTSDIFTKISATLDDTLANLKTKYQPVLDELMIGNLRALEDYLVLDENNVDPNLLTLKFAPDGNQNYTINLTISTADKKISNITLTGIEFNGYLLNLELDLHDFEEIVVDKTQFAPLDNLLYGVDNLIKDKANISLSGTIADAVDESIYVTQLGANVQYDPISSDYYGRLDVKAKTNLDHYPYHHIVEFDYAKPDIVEGGTDPELLARYYSMDDNTQNTTTGMFVNMHQSKILSLVDRIKNIPDANVIFKMVERIKLQSEIIPLESILAGNYELIFNDWLKEFSVTPIQAGDITQQEIRVKLDGKLLGLDTLIDLYICLDTTNNEIKSLKLTNFNIAGKVANVEIKFAEFDESKVGQRLSITHPKSNKDVNYFDFDKLDILLAFGINTTMASSYHLQGYFKLTVPELLDSTLFRIADIFYKLDARITILDGGKVNAYLKLEQMEGSPKDMKPGGTAYIKNTVTEIAIDETDDAIIYQTREEKFGLLSGWQRITEMFRVKSEEVTKNLHFYLVKYILRFSDFVYNQIENGINSSTQDPKDPVNPILKFEYESIFETMDYIQADPTSDKPNTAYFASRINLQKALDMIAAAKVIQADKVDVKVGFDVNEMLLTEIKLYSDSLLFVTLSGSTSSIGKMKVGIDFYVENMKLGTIESELADFKDLVEYYKHNVSEDGQKLFAEYQGGGKITNVFNVPIRETQK